MFHNIYMTYNFVILELLIHKHTHTSVKDNWKMILCGGGEDSFKTKVFKTV